MLSMLKTVLGNLFTKKATRAYPAEKRPMPGYRGELLVDIGACVFCGACARVCPARCLTVDIKGTSVTTDPFACVYCGVCVDECPTAAMEMRTWHTSPAGEKQTFLQKGEKKTKEQIAELKKRRDGTAA